ncbi:hypothetical protein SHIRM173S_10416 [Streptomyces hirsutus]
MSRRSKFSGSATEKPSKGAAQQAVAGREIPVPEGAGVVGAGVGSIPVARFAPGRRTPGAWGTSGGAAGAVAKAGGALGVSAADPESVPGSPVAAVSTTTATVTTARAVPSVRLLPARPRSLRTAGYALRSRRRPGTASGAVPGFSSSEHTAERLADHPTGRPFRGVLAQQPLDHRGERSRSQGRAQRQPVHPLQRGLRPRPGHGRADAPRPSCAGARPAPTGPPRARRPRRGPAPAPQYDGAVSPEGRDGARQAETGDHDRTGLPHEHLAGAEFAVGHARAVRGVQYVRAAPARCARPGRR